MLNWLRGISAADPETIAVIVTALGVFAGAVLSAMRGKRGGKPTSPQVAAAIEASAKCRSFPEIEKLGRQAEAIIQTVEHENERTRRAIEHHDRKLQEHDRSVAQSVRELRDVAVEVRAFLQASRR